MKIGNGEVLGQAKAETGTESGNDCQDHEMKLIIEGLKEYIVRLDALGKAAAAAHLSMTIDTLAADIRSRIE